MTEMIYIKKKRRRTPASCLLQTTHNPNVFFLVDPHDDGRGHGVLLIRFDSLKNSTRSLMPDPVISTDVLNSCPPVICNVATPE